jgi:hypothetical protein
MTLKIGAARWDSCECRLALPVFAVPSFANQRWEKEGPKLLSVPLQMFIGAVALWFQLQFVTDELRDEDFDS